MATKYDSSLIPSSLTLAAHRAYVQFIHDAFLLGFVKTADSGQVTPSAIAATTAANQVQGYNIFRTNDALSAIYFKVEYGSGATNGFPSLWITIGTGSDGSGGITGNIFLPRQQINSAGTSTTAQQICFASGANNRLTLAMFLTTIAYGFWFSFERRKDNNLADADTGILIDWGLTTSGHSSLCAPFTGVIPSVEKGLQFILTSNSPGIYNNLVPEGLRIPCLGPSEPPGRNIALCNNGDWGDFAEPTLTINGTEHVFKHCGPRITTLRGGNTGPYDATTRLLLRYE